MSVTISPPMFLQFFDPNNSGAPLSGGKLFTYIAGTSTKQATWTDSTQLVQNSNPIILDSNGAAYVWLDPALLYKFVLSPANDTDPPSSPLRSVDNISPLLSAAALTQAILGIVIYPRTAAEITAGVIPTNYIYPPGDLRRYGAVGDGSTDDSAAWQKAVNVGLARIPGGFSFKIVTPATKTGQVTVLGEGKSSKLLCDATVLTVTNGTGSVVDNFWMENITAPWIITRNPANWAANISGTLQQSNTVLGYQPTVNDADIWSTLTAPQQTQQVGPVIQFTGAADNIKVSRIYGRFVRVDIRDAIDSCVEDCDFRGGKGVYGAISFDNWTNAIQRGSGNRAVNNRVKFASFCGVVFMANDDFTTQGNVCYLNGESGVKTYQSFGAIFTASVGGATTGTLTVAATNGVYTFVFSSGEVRTVTITGTTTATWSGALTAGSTFTASYYTSGFNAQCIRGQINSNHCFENYFDGVDSLSCFPTCDAASTYHQVIGNHTFNNGGNGINTDGRFNQYTGNHVYFNNRFGIWGQGLSLSGITANVCIDNNQSRSSSQGDITAAGNTAGCQVSGNYVWGGATQNGPGIFVLGTHFIGDNFGAGNTTFFFGNPGAIASTVQNYVDSSTGNLTDQSWTLWIQNNAGTLQHTFISDPGGAALSNYVSRINAASSSFTTTPTGADASTPMAAGGKIGSGSANFFWCDTAVQIPVNAQMAVSIGTNSTGTAVNVQAQFSSLNINGVTRVRLALGFTNAATGAAFNLNTTNIPAGTFLKVVFYGKLA